MAVSKGGAKRNAPKAICNLSCKLPILRFGALHVFRFWLLGASANYPKRFARVDGICDASLASRDCTLSTGGAQES